MYNCSNGISINSKAEMAQMMKSILQDNDANQRSKGFSPLDWIDVFEVSAEVMQLNDLWKQKQPFGEVVASLLTDPKKKIKASDEGDGCCGGDESPQAKVLALIPRLNEVILGEIISEMSQSGVPEFKYSREQLIKSLNKMMVSFSCYRRAY